MIEFENTLLLFEFFFLMCFKLSKPIHKLFYYAYLSIKLFWALKLEIKFKYFDENK